MKRKRHTPQEIIAKLREAEVELNQGATIAAAAAAKSAPDGYTLISARNRSP